MSSKVFKTGFSLPNGLRIYAIGDVHGHLAALEAMHEAIAFDLIEDQPQDLHIVYLGDYIDRGPDSAGVLDCLIGRRDRGDGIEKTFLCGNHEQGMIEFIEDGGGAVGSVWLDWGGRETLESYGIHFESPVLLPSEKEAAAELLFKAIPDAHWAFLKALKNSVRFGEYVFAHAGVDPTLPFDEQKPDDLRFIREPFLSWPKPLEKMVVHGHTKTDGEPEILPHRINVDTGCYDTGILSAVVLEGDNARFLHVDLRDM